MQQLWPQSLGCYPSPHTTPTCSLRHGGTTCPSKLSQRLAQLAEGPCLSSNHRLRSSRSCLPGDSQAQPPSGAARRSWGSRQGLTTSEQPQPRGKPLPTQPQTRSRGFLSLLCWRSVKHSAPRYVSAAPPGQGPPRTLETSSPCFKPQHVH